MDLSVIYIVWLRDIKRTLRDRVSLIGSVLRSVLWLIIMGSGLRSTFTYIGGITYVEFIFPGIIGMALLFGSVQSAITIVWEKEFGFFKELLVAPVPRASIAMGKALSGTVLGVGEGLVVMALASIVGVELTLSSALWMFLVMILAGYFLSLMGIAIALSMKNFEGFGVVVNLLLMPMFFFSGAIFPIPTLPDWIKYIVMINPLSYGVDALRAISVGLWDFSLPLDIAILSVLAVIMTGIIIVRFQNKKW